MSSGAEITGSFISISSHFLLAFILAKITSGGIQTHFSSLSASKSAIIGGDVRLFFFSRQALISYQLLAFILGKMSPRAEITVSLISKASHFLLAY